MEEWFKSVDKQAEALLKYMKLEYDIILSFTKCTLIVNKLKEEEREQPEKLYVYSVISLN